MIPQARPHAIRARESFFPDVLEGQFRPAELFFAIMVARAKNKRYRKYQRWRIHKLVPLIREMRYRLGSSRKIIIPKGIEGQAR